ncbi:MAG TPA: glycosyltransferase [Oligoflexia bacterium]|nr:glycosyltransferase [Oligoflexia bacterium]
MRLTVVVPTFNEADTIENSLREIERVLGPELSKDTELLIADDGSDPMPELVERLKKEIGFARLELLRNSPPVGKGLSLARAFERAQGRTVGFLDADLSTPATYILEALKVLEANEADLYIGSRRAMGANVVREQFWLKDVLGDALRVGVNAVIFRLGRKYSDTQCGFKFFKNQVAKVLYCNLVAYDGVTDVEILVRANLLGYRVCERGVEWCDTRESKRSLKRILIGDLKAITRIMWHYGVFEKKQIKDLRRFEKTLI